VQDYVALFDQHGPQVDGLAIGGADDLALVVNRCA
jgi:hypothetical protein